MEILFMLRKSQKWTQEELAQRLHVKQGTISQWEQGERSPSVAALRKIACLFGVTVSYLLGETEGGRDDKISSGVGTKEAELS